MVPVGVIIGEREEVIRPSGGRGRWFDTSPPTIKRPSQTGTLEKGQLKLCLRIGNHVPLAYFAVCR